MLSIKFIVPLIVLSIALLAISIGIVTNLYGWRQLHSNYYKKVGSIQDKIADRFLVRIQSKEGTQIDTLQIDEPVSINDEVTYYVLKSNSTKKTMKSEQNNYKEKIINLIIWFLGLSTLLFLCFLFRSKIQNMDDDLFGHST